MIFKIKHNTDGGIKIEFINYLYFLPKKYKERYFNEYFWLCFHVVVYFNKKSV